MVGQRLHVRYASNRWHHDRRRRLSGTGAQTVAGFWRDGRDEPAPQIDEQMQQDCDHILNRSVDQAQPCECCHCNGTPRHGLFGLHLGRALWEGAPPPVGGCMATQTAAKIAKPATSFVHSSLHAHRCTRPSRLQLTLLHHNHPKARIPFTRTEQDCELQQPPVRENCKPAATDSDDRSV